MERYAKGVLLWCIRRSVVCVSVCVLVTLMNCAKTVEPIEMSFGGPTGSNKPCIR